MALMKRLFKGPGEVGNVGNEPAAPLAGDATQDFAAEPATRRELLRVRTRNTLRLCGIPEQWVEAQVLLEPEGGRTFLHLRLVVRHWDERLLRFAFAFQTRLLHEIERIDPQVPQWLRSIVWQFPHDLACPYSDLPEPSAWLELGLASHDAVEPPPLASEPEPDPEAAQLQADLAKLLAMRDADLAGRSTRS